MTRSARWLEVVAVVALVAMGALLWPRGEPLPPEPPAPTQDVADTPREPPAVERDFVTRESGLRYRILRPGKGAVAEPGMIVTAHYTGWLEATGAKFDSTLDRGQPFDFQLGAGQVIPGWDEGVAGMREGERRRLVIPPELGYGARGAGRVIPPNATMVFDVELVEVAPPP